ncbi:DUF4944 domain-containing protein [Bacillus paralicheniformis]|uniref:DUF4944 domain-containing protein n=1 Tax=Bacillus paralicheniformis TaxID=1648923 RepID=UPI00128D018A|nr:DUF4944 domain-containing protein [Bacillus paralicheniformis]MPQ27342.1 DUF4944 domain-containing protein [Bacillus paralicheniformis]
MKQYSRPIIFISCVFFAFLMLFFGFKLYNYYNSEYPKWEGKSKDQNWEVTIKKGEINSGYSGDLYWIGDKKNIDNTYLEQLVVKFDNEIALNDSTETPIKDYSGGTFENGASKEKSVSFLAELEESQLTGHKVTVQVKWKQGNKKYTSEISLNKKTFLNH